jgi:hypothetical protein
MANQHTSWVAVQWDGLTKGWDPGNVGAKDLDLALAGHDGVDQLEMFLARKYIDFNRKSCCWALPTKDLQICVKVNRREGQKRIRIMKGGEEYEVL